MSTIKDIVSLDEIQAKKQQLSIQESLLLEKGLSSNDPEEILKAAKHWKDIEQRQESGVKTILTDPLDMAQGLGYKQKLFSVSYDTLYSMSRTPIVRSIITTRIEQVAAFAEPQPNKYATGFVIRKKNLNGGKVEKGDSKIINQLTEFVLNCGTGANTWHGDTTFDTYLRKYVQDSLTWDQACSEVVRNRKGLPVEFLMGPSDTYRIASSFDDDRYKGPSKVAIQGYLPSYVQVIDGAVRNEFYPWELMFGIRNPTTSLYQNGYGQSELEDLIQVVTSLLYSDQYNSSFFRNGSAPKGIIKIKGNVSPDKLASFRQQWRAMVAGVSNANKTPIMNADEMEWIDLQKNNRDMEFTKYQEYLIRLTCSLYKIDPSEIGFTMSGSADSKPMFEGNNEARLKYSKDKGLKPLLKHIASRINKYIITPLNPQYELVFVGLDTEDPTAELDSDIKKLSNFMTVNEIRKKYDMSPVKEQGDLILNSVYYQAKAADQMNQQQQQPGMDQADDNPFLKGLITNIVNELTTK